MYHRYKNDPEILAMTNLIAAYQRNEILEFEKILKVKHLAWHDIMSYTNFAFKKNISISLFNFHVN